MWYRTLKFGVNTPGRDGIRHRRALCAQRGRDRLDVEPLGDRDDRDGERLARQVDHQGLEHTLRRYPERACRADAVGLGGVSGVVFQHLEFDPRPLRGGNRRRHGPRPLRSTAVPVRAFSSAASPTSTDQ